MRGGFEENKAQTKAILTTEGPMIIISCPGSGKTTTMIRRINNLLEKGAAPERILMVTFTKNAARDMADRYREYFKRDLCGVTFATIHSMCFTFLSEMKITDGFGICAPKEEVEFLINEERYFSSYIDNPAELALQVAQEISAMRNREMPLDQYMPKCCRKEVFEKLYLAYEKYKQENHKIDFDDMIILLRDKLRDDEVARRRYQERYDYIQCDEYQDTNGIQRDILYMLSDKPNKHNLCVVGDDDQAIYRFRGTDNAIMRQFREDFESRGIPCTEVHMETNYRCRQRIVDISAMCIKENRGRIKKNFRSGRNAEDGDTEKGVYRYIKAANAVDEAVRAAEIVKECRSRGVEYRKIAILYRKNRQVSLPAQMLSAENIPYNTSDRLTCMYDEWMFRDIKAYADLSMGRDVESNRTRILNRPSRYFSAKAFKDLPYTSDGMLRGIEDKKGGQPWQYAAAEKALFTWMNCFGPGKISENDSPKVLFDRLCGKGSIRYDKYIEERARFMNEDRTDLFSQYEELKKDAMKFSTIAEWFAHAGRVSTRVQMDSRKKDPDGVWLSTIHGAKGMQWDAVIVIGVNKNNIPGKTDSIEDTEEERRILYVAMTRAANELYIMYYGAESEFMVQANAAYKELRNPVVPKKPRGTPVQSRKYGVGKVEGYTKDRILIRYPDAGLKKYRFPDAINKKHIEYLK